MYRMLLPISNKHVTRVGDEISPYFYQKRKKCAINWSKNAKLKDNHGEHTYSMHRMLLPISNKHVARVGDEISPYSYQKRQKWAINHQKCEIKKINRGNTPIPCIQYFSPSLLSIMPLWGMKSPHIPIKKGKNMP